MSSDRKHFAKANLLKILSIPFFVFGWLLAWVVPRQRNKWVFGSAAGVGEGALPVALSVRQQFPHDRIVWVVGNDTENTSARDYGFIPVKRYSFSGFWNTLRAGHIVFTHGHGDVNRFGVFRGEITHLIHGAPLKRLHLDSLVTTAVRGPSLLAKILRWMYALGSSQITLFVAGSDVAAERLRTAYGVLPGKVKVLGDARDDVIVRDMQSVSAQQLAREKLHTLCGVPLNASQPQKPSRFVLYAPTWRDGADDPSAPQGAEAESLLRMLERENAYLVIRSHPLGAGQYEHLFGDRVVALGSDIVRDINPLLCAFDLVITDYSSIAIDFSLLSRPILWCAPDLDTYSLTRGLYEPLEVTAAGKVTRGWSDAVSRLGLLLNEGSIEHRVAVRDATALQKRFHAYPQTESAERVVHAITRLSFSDEKLILPHAVFFESFYGTKVTCNPEALDREIARTHPEVARYWSVLSETAVVPAGAIPVLVGSVEWFAARRSAQVLIVNDWLRFRFTPKKNQIVLQTWHGTMLKHLALERPNVKLRTRIAIRRESRRWSLLLSQNPHSTEHFQKSYAYTGRILELGYPRVDALVNSLAGEVRSPILRTAAKRKLGVADSAKVLSYVPTWRDHNLSQVNIIDVQKLADELGAEWVVVARAHTRSTVAGGYHSDSGRVVDASEYPDINDVIIAADLLVTDYSSVMFDASAARVPLAFFVPDLQSYRDVERGFTFDFETDAPGPLCETREEIVALAQALETHGLEAQWIAQYAQSAERFRARFAPHDSGTVSAQVVHEVELLGGLPPTSARA